MNRRRFLKGAAAGLAALTAGATAVAATDEDDHDEDLPQPTVPGSDDEYVREPVHPGLNAGGPPEPVEEEEDYVEQPNRPGPNAGRGGE
jgi:hypothetical protein